MTTKIEISHRTIIFIIGFLMSIWLVVEIREILFLLFISFIIMSALRPFVEFLEQYRVPRALSIFAIYIVVFGFFGVWLGSVVPALVTQTRRLISDFPRYVAAISPYYEIDIRSLSAQIAPIGENLVKVTVGVFSNIVTTLTVLVFTFYLLLERKHLERYIRSFVAKDMGDRLVNTIVAVETSLGAWLRGELILMFCIGLVTYAGLTFLRIEFALPLAIFAGLLEIVPVIGPIVSAVPAVLIALTVSPFLGVATAALYFVIQQLENSLVVPMVMKKAVNLSPIIIIVALMIGSKLAGVVGGVLSIPIVVMLRAILLETLAKDR